MTWETMFDLLLEFGVVSEEALGLACALCGRNTDTMESVLYYYTGWRSFEGWLEEINGED